MISTDLFNRLRTAQLRAVREQELLSCRNWILICAVVHVMALVHPTFLMVHVLLLRSYERGPVVHSAVAVAATLLSGLMMVVFWGWARYAPYRAALGALLSFLALQALAVAADPRQLWYGTIIKVVILIGLVHAVVVAHGRRRPQ